MMMMMMMMIERMVVKTGKISLKKRRRKDGKQKKRIEIRNKTKCFEMKRNQVIKSAKNLILNEKKYNSKEQMESIFI